MTNFMGMGKGAWVDRVKFGGISESSQPDSFKKTRKALVVATIPPPGH
jgi:hypothetical protein